MNDGRIDTVLGLLFSEPPVITHRQAAILLDYPGAEQPAVDPPAFDNHGKVETYEQAMAALRLLWSAADRPWFCRKCHTGKLKPFGQDGFCCERISCGATYRLDAK